MILIVDDDQSIRELFGALLQSAGHRVVLAGNGVQAGRLLAALPCRLVISDYEMPGQNGVQLLTAARARYAGIRTILMSGNPELPRLAQQAGADRYYRKVSPLTELTAAVRALLEDAGG